MYIEKHMLQNLFKKIFTPTLGILLCICLYSICTLPALFDSDHLLYNLEPYPDGILYTDSSRNFISGNGLQLVYNGNKLPLWVPPVYPMFLSLFYVISSAPQLFYIANITAGIITIGLIYCSGAQLSHNKWVGVLASFLFVLHGNILWLPTVPMTENIALVGILITLRSFQLENQKHKIIVGLLGISSLIFTRYALTPVAITAGLLLIIDILKLKLTKHDVIVFGKLSICFSVAVLLVRFNQIRDFIYNMTHASQFYGFSFFIHNVIAYTKGLLGFPIQFLWLELPFTSGLLSIFVVFMSIYLWIKQQLTSKDKKSIVILLSVFLSQLPLLLIFYTVDARYYIYSLPLLCLLSSWYLFILFRKEKKLAISIMILIISTLIFSQKSMYKQLVANNLLGRSSAVQYKAIQHFKEFFKENDDNPVLITALPPFLVTSYFPYTPTLLPLSSVQEFVQKDEYVWGEEIEYENLQKEYFQRLERGEKLYISNAYITHQQEVIHDFESIKNNFNLQLVSSGCLEACNLYLITKKGAEAPF